MEVARLRAILDGETRGLDRALDHSERRLDQFARDAKRAGDKAADGLMSGFDKVRLDKLKTLGAGIGTAAASASLVAFGKNAIKTAASTEEAINKVNVTFGRNGAEINRWAKTTSNALGVSRLQALEAAGTFGTLLKTSGLNASEAARMSKNLVKLSSDLASFHNVTGGAAEAAEKLRSGLVGEAEPLRALGVLLSEARVKSKAMELGLADANGALSEGAKVQARYALILEDSKDAIDDYSRTAGSLPNKQRDLNAAFDDFSGSLGKELIPLAKDATEVLKKLLEAYNKIPPDTRKLLIGGATIGAVAGPTLGGFATVASLGASLKTAKALKGLKGGAGVAGTTGAAGAGLGEAAVTGAALAAAATATARERAFSGGSHPGIEGALRSGKLNFPSVADAANAKVFSMKISEEGIAAGKAAAQSGRLTQLGSKLKGGPGALISTLLAEAGLSVLPNQGNTGIFKRVSQATVGGAGAGALAGSFIPGVGTAFGAGLGALAFGGHALAGELGSLAGHRDAPGLTSRVKGRRSRAASAAAELGRPGARPSLLEDPEIQDARFDAMLMQAETRAAAAPESLRARVTAREQLPILKKQQDALRARLAKLKPQFGKDKEATEKYLKAEKELAASEQDSLKLREDAAEESQQARKKTRERFAKLQEAEFGNRLQAAETAARDTAAPGNEARATNHLVGDVLVARMSALAAAAKDEKDHGKYLELQREWLEAKDRLVGLDLNAEKEEKSERKRLADLTLDGLKERAQALAQAAPEGKEAQTLAQNLIPALRQRQQKLLQDMQELRQDSTEFLEKRAEYWKLNADVAQLDDGSMKEQKDNAKKAADAAKKAIDNAKKAAGEAADVAELKVKLKETELQNNPLLNDRQRKAAMLPVLQERLRVLSKPVEGETEKEALERKMRFAEAKGDLMKQFGLGKSVRMGGGVMRMGDLRGAQAALSEFGGIPGMEGEKPRGSTRRAGMRPYLGGIKLRMADMGDAQAAHRLGRMPANPMVGEKGSPGGNVYNFNAPFNYQGTGNLDDPKELEKLEQAFGNYIKRGLREMGGRPRRG